MPHDHHEATSRERTTDATVLSGAEERGVDGPSLARSYFSQVQPISFLFSDPSSSHIAELVARIRYSISMLHTYATHAGPGKRLKYVFRPVDVESFRNQQCR